MRGHGVFMSSESLSCWKCGTRIDDEPMPLGREARCRTCQSDLHVCRQCLFYDTGKAKDCAEPVADEVRDKERANFCGYFKLNADAHGASGAADEARRSLEAMFGMDAGSAPPADTPDAEALGRRRDQEAADARSELDRLFGLDDEK